MQAAAPCRLAGGTPSRPAPCEPARHRRSPLAAAPRPHTRCRTLPHDSAATLQSEQQQQLWLQQQPEGLQPEGLQLNNAVEHGRRGKRQPQPALPPRVERLLSSPLLERPDGTDPRQFLRVMEAFWAAQKQAFADPASAPRPPTVVQRSRGSCGGAEFDVAVAGGTLGILLALALQARGHRVAVIERRRLEGRSQEWNISAAELANLVDCGLLTSAELASCIVSSWDSVQVNFHGGEPVNCGGDILDCGVSPKRLLAVLRRRFLEAGGAIFEQHTFKAARVCDDGVAIQLLPSTTGSAAIEPGDVNRPMALHHDHSVAPSSGSGGGGSNGGPQRRRELTARLLVDCMGHFSPIVKQMREGQQPDGMLLVVGGCWAGMPAEANRTTDLLATVTDSADDMQLFWEAFPAADGRTVYMFSYSDAHPSRPSFAELLDTYCRLLPAYQGVSLEQLQPRRMLMGGFPCYGRAPLRPGWDRVLQIGDAGAGQSPLSFGGFGSMVRHLPRLVAGVSEALQEDRLSRADLSLLAPYQPSLSAAWLLQRAMAVRPGELQAAAPAAAQQQQACQQQGGQPTLQQQASQQTAQPAGQLQPSQQQQQSRDSGWLPPNQINRLLRCNFAVLRALGRGVMRPFLTDTFQALPLALTMVGMSFVDPLCVLRSMRQVGPALVLSWVRHFLALALFTAAYTVLQPLTRAVPLLRRSRRVRRLLDALRWGAGLDYRRAESDSASQVAAVMAAAAPPAT